MNGRIDIMRILYMFTNGTLNVMGYIIFIIYMYMNGINYIKVDCYQFMNSTSYIYSETIYIHVRHRLYKRGVLKVHEWHDVHIGLYYGNI